MPPAYHRLRACTTCTKAKRPCNKQLPRCERCQQRGMVCKYPPARQSAWDYALAHASEVDVPNAESTPAATPPAATPPAKRGPTSEIMGFDTGFSPKDSSDFQYLFEVSRGSTFAQPDPRVEDGRTGLTVPSSKLQPFHELVLKCTIPRQEDWFYAPESWNIIRSTDSEFSIEIFEMAGLRQFVKTIQDWVCRWGTTGRNPFIHHRLYNKRFPSVIQDAYTVLAAYLSRTAETTELCFRIIQDRVARLVQDNLNVSTSSLAEPTMIPVLDPLDHLARVQAFLVYQSIGLLDGDIMLRETAERYMPLLIDWTEAMWVSAELDSNIHSAINDLDVGSGENGIAMSYMGEDEETASWNRWIVSESIRRTWITVTLTNSIYNVLKTGSTACSGGVKWTARAGVWDVDDAYTWKDAVRNGSSPLFVPSCFADVLFSVALPSDVDEFGHAIMGAEYGLEKVAKWKALAKRRAR